MDWIRALKVVGCSLNLFGHPIITHLGIPRFIPAHVQNLSSLLSCVWSVSNLLAIAVRSSAYAADEILTLEVPKVYPLFPCCSHLRRDSRNMINRYGLSVSPYIVPLWMGIGRVLPKCSPVNIIEDCEYMFPMRVMESVGYPRSFILAKSLA